MNNGDRSMDYHHVVIMKTARIILIPLSGTINHSLSYSIIGKETTKTIDQKCSDTFALIAIHS